MALWIVFCPLSFGKTDFEGIFLIESQSVQNLKSFLNYNQLHLKGSVHPTNELTIYSHFLFFKLYGSHSYSLKTAIEVYPSVNWLMHEDIQLKLGRLLYKHPFHQIISSDTYDSFIYSFDGIFLEYDTAILKADIWSAYLPKRWTGLKKEKDFEYGSGVFLDIKFTESYINSFNFYVAYLADSFFQQSAEKMSRYGIALKGLIQPFNLNYTFITVGHGSSFQFKLEENMYHFSLDYFQSNFFNSHFFTGYHTDSLKYEPWLYDRYKNTGYSDLFLWGNLNYYFTGFSISPIDRWKFKLAFYDFNATQNGSLKLGYVGEWMNSSKANIITVSKGKLGKELNFMISNQINKELLITLNTAFFLPQKNLENVLKSKELYSNVLLTMLYSF